MSKYDIQRRGSGNPNEGQMVWVPPNYEIVVDNGQGNQAGGGGQESHLWDHLILLWRRRWLILLFFVICTSVAFVKALRSTPLYTASAKLEVKPTEKRIIEFQDSAATNNSRGFIDTQRQIFYSRELAKKVVLHLNLFEGIGRQPKQTDVKEESLFASFQDSMGKAKNKFLSYVSGRQYDADEQKGPLTEEEILQRRINAFLSGLRVSQVGETDLLVVSYSSTNPEFSSRVANTVCDEYIKWSYELRHNSYEYAWTWLGEKLDELKARLEESEEKLYAAAGSKNFMPGVDDSTELTGQLQRLRAELSTAEKTLFDKELRLAEFSGDISPTFLIQNQRENSRLQQLKQEYKNMELEYARLKATLGAKMPQVQTAKATMDELKKQIKEEEGTRQKEVAENWDLLKAEAKNEVKLAQANYDYIKEKYDKERKQLSELQQGLIQYTILKREADVNRQLYNSLLQRWKEVQVTSEIKPSNVSVVDYAVPPLTPQMKSKQRTILAGAMLGLMLGIGFVFFLEYMDLTVRDGEDLERFAQIASLGMVPRYEYRRGERHERENVDLACHNHPKSSFAESVRIARTSVQFSMPDRSPRVILVTSSLPGEGKTTIATNLATVYAQRGESVLLVDSDMKKPAIHKSFGMDSSPGLSETLTGHFDGLHVPESEVPNLYVLPSGSKPPNPVDLLDSDAMRTFLGQASDIYDQIIIDSAPILQVADTAVLGQYVDGVVIVAQPGRTPRKAVRRARERLQEFRSRTIGAILNNPKQNARYGKNYSYGAGGYNYGYGYGYGSSYGADDEDESPARGKKRVKSSVVEVAFSKADDGSR
ncbi:MAG: GumC family protein [Candidatus Sumerlaeia bacterium]